MFLNLTPIRRNKDYRFLYIGQIVSFLGSMISYVAVPYQIYEITKDSFYVGLVGGVQLIPVLVFGLWGGSVADTIDRRRLLLITNAIMCLCCFALIVNAMLPHPNLIAIFVIVALLQSATAFHRPAHEAIVQKIVAPEDLPAVSTLSMFRYSFGAILGPLIGGMIVGQFGPAWAYAVDLLTFGISYLTIHLMSIRHAPEDNPQSPIAQILEGIKYAAKKPELVGTYIVDIVAMTFAFPTALFPAMGEQWGGGKITGLLYSGMAIGSLAISLFGSWAEKVKRTGRMVCIGAGFWALAIFLLGFSSNLWLAMTCLIFAGAADTVSGIMRGLIWNQSVDNNMRGRLAGLEMISYMTGPLLGNLRAGWMAGIYGNAVSIASGGFVCMFGVALCAFLLPKFWKYQSAGKN